MKLSETRIFYTPLNDAADDPKYQAGQIELVSIHKACFDDRRFSRSTGACYGYVQALDSKQSREWIFNLAVHLIVRDAMDPITVHNTLCNIREYRDGLALDMPMPEKLLGKFKRETANTSSWGGLW